MLGLLRYQVTIFLAVCVRWSGRKGSERTNRKAGKSKLYPQKNAQIRVWSRSLIGLTWSHIAERIISQTASNVKIMSTLRTLAEHILQTHPDPVGESKHLFLGFSGLNSVHRANWPASQQRRPPWFC